MLEYFLHCIIQPIFVPETPSNEPVKSKEITASKILDTPLLVKAKSYLKPPERLLHIDIKSKIETAIENNILRQAVQGMFD